MPVRFSTLDALTSEHMAAPRFRALLIGLFAAVALALAAIGIFGAMAYVVGQRTAEIGLRVALGARPGQVLWLVCRRGLALTTIGLALGLAGALAAARLLGTLLFEIGPTDPVTYASVAALLTGAALTALYMPARCALGVDPLVALRCE